MQRRRAADSRLLRGESAGGELIARLARERVPSHGNFLRVGFSEQPPEAARIVILDVGVEQPERGEKARRRRHDDALHAERLSHAAGEHRAIAAESEQRELARIAPALSGPTCSEPAASIQTSEPPPAPTSARSIAGTFSV